jgi:hypothetical protein
MSPNPKTDETGSGPVDGDAVKVEIAPHHQAHANKKPASFGRIALTGAAVVGGVVGIFLLYKHFFGRRAPKKGDRGSKMRKRDFETIDLQDEVNEVYLEALEDEEFLEFLAEVNEKGLFEEFT